MASVKDYGNGKYRVIICLGKKEDGSLNRASKVIEANSLKAANKLAAQMEVELKNNLKMEANTDKGLTEATFKDLVEEWRKKEVTHYSVSTLDTYNGIINNYMIPVFGTREVQDIAKKDVSDYIYSLSQDGVKQNGKPGGLSQKSIRNHFVLMSALLSYAIDYDMVKENVCSQIKHKPEVDIKEASFYNPDEVERMLDCLEDELQENHLQKVVFSRYSSDVCNQLNHFVGLMYKTYIYLALASACRRSEMLGLDWQDVDYEKMLVCVKKVSLYTPDSGIITKFKLKNGAPSKVITLPIEVIELLKLYRQEQERMRKIMGSDWADSDRVFIAVSGGNASQPGGAMNPDTISQWFDKFLSKYKLPKITLHEVRHTSISYLINAKLDIKTIAERAGHRDTSVTTRIYGHVFDKNKRECADVISDLFK